MTAPIAIIMEASRTGPPCATRRDLTALGIACEKHIIPRIAAGPAIPPLPGARAAGFKNHYCRRRRCCPSARHDRLLDGTPVFGVPVESKALSGVDFALFDCSRCPPGFRSYGAGHRQPGGITPPCSPESGCAHNRINRQAWSHGPSSRSAGGHERPEGSA